MLQEEITKSDIKLIGNANSDLIQQHMAGPNRKKCSKEQMKKSLKYSYLVGSRAFGLVDIITDGYLLYLSSQNKNLYFLTLALVISMASPYIISYSSGVQLYLFRQTFDNVEGFKKILMILFLLPTGIFYFVFLDLADILLHLFRWFYFVLCCRSLQRIGETEQILSEQLGMDRMNWEGFKRQRGIGQLMFESLPQFLFQVAIFYIFYEDVFGGGEGIGSETKITPLQLSVSIGFACVNIVSTFIKLKLEAKCCKSTFISYCLCCIKARVGWVPQREHILAAATKQERTRKKLKHKEKAGDEDSDSEHDIPEVDYDMHHRILWYKHNVEYDFSVTTIRYLMSALQMINTTNNQDDIHPLRINFRNSLRLLPLQDIIELYSLCQVKNIDVMSMKGGNHKYYYDWSYAIKMSERYGKDPRLLQFSRDDQGMPYIMKLMQLSNYNDRRQIFCDLIEHDFDLNIHDLTTNESIVYTLIRSYDYKNLRYIFTHYCKNKGVLIRMNYHNKDGISPLGLALKLYEKELAIRKKTPVAANHTMRPTEAPYLWQVLVLYGAELSFPCKKNYSSESTDGDMSPLQFVLKELKNKDLARELMKVGAQLYSKEIGHLNELFVNYELDEEEAWQPPVKLIDRKEEKDDGDDEEDKWEKDEDYVEHHSEAPRDGSWLALLCEVAAHCGRPIDFITDSNGNNPLHHFINDFNLKNKHKTRRKKMKTKQNLLKLKRLRHLMFICNGSWTNEKNQDSDYPFQLIVKKRDPDLFFEFAELDDQFKQNIMEKKIFVQQIIDWILSITERITKKYPQGLNKKGKVYQDERIAQDMDVQTLDKLFTVKYLGKLIQWPNKYKKVQGAATISLIDTALEKELVEVTLYLKQYWRFPLKTAGREKIKEIQDAREQKKLLGIEFGRVKTRIKLSKNKSNMPAHSTMLRASSALQREKEDNAQSSGALINGAPPVLRAHTLMRLGSDEANSPLADVDMISVVDRYKAQKSERNEDIMKHGEKSKIETIYSFFVEVLSTADFITDIMVVIALIKLKHAWEISFMLLFMISPYLVSHSIMCSLIDSRRESFKLDMLQDINTKCGTKCAFILINMLAMILMTPLAIAWFTLVDVTFMVYLILSTIFFLLTCGYYDISDKMDDLLFKKCLGMSRMQIIGYRRLRTLSQLLFETIPQIALQSWILYRNQGAESQHISDTDIYISIGVAVIHFILEIFIIYLDARASKMSLTHYAVICLGARLNWVPYAHQIRQNKKVSNNDPYNFENIDCDPWFFKMFGSDQRYRIEYEFSPSSIKKLGEYFINLRILSSTEAPSNPYLSPVWLYYYMSNSLPVIYLGKTCCRSLDVYSFAEFFRSADKKVTLISKLDWTRIIFENTPNTSPDNVYLKRLCEEFINYAEIKLITQLAPVVNLSTTDIIMYILHVSAHNLLLALKKYYNENIHFGLSTEIMQAIYNVINQNNWIISYRADPSYAKVIFLLMWYTRRTIHRHQDPRGDIKFIMDKNRREFLEKAVERTLPNTFEVVYDSDVVRSYDYNNDGVNKLQTIMLNNNSSYNRAPLKTTNTISNTMETKEESESDYELAPDWNEEEKHGTYLVNLAEEDDFHEVGFEVEFEILECFKYFQPQIEEYLIDLTKQLKHSTEYLRIGNKELFTFFKKVFNKQTIDFLKLIINSPWHVLQQFPVHVRFAELFSRIDPVIRRLEMVHGYGKYLLCSSKYRQSNKLKPMVHIVAIEYDNQNIENDEQYEEEKENLLSSNKYSEINNNQFTNSQILDIQTDPAYHGHQSLRTGSIMDLNDSVSHGIALSRYPRNNKVKKKYMYNKTDIMGISRIEIDFQAFEFKQEHNQHIIGGIYGDDDVQEEVSAGKIELFTILPQKTKIVNDKLMLNKVVLKEISFEELESLKDKKLIVDLFDNEILGMFRPIYIGRDRIELMPLRLNIEPSRQGIQVKCDQIEARITYVLRRFIDATAMKFESVLHKACSLQNLDFIQFIHAYQDIFDCNAVDDDYQNALHLLCGMGTDETEGEDEEPDLEIFNLVLSLRDIDVNQIRFDGKTPFKLLEENYKIDVEKKNEMLKQISAMPSYRPIISKSRDKIEKRKVKNVLLFGNKNSGRHSLLKQLQIHYEKRAFSAWEKSVERSKIIKYLIKTMKVLIKHCGDDEIATLADDDAYAIYSIKSNNLRTIERLPTTFFDSLSRLWDNPAIRRVYYENGERLNLSDSVRYFFYRIAEIKKSNYIPNELDILRSPYHNEKTVLTSKSYRVDDDIASDLQIRWILPSKNKILSLSNNSENNEIDTIIFMISLTSFMEINPDSGNDNNFIKSLKLFNTYCNDKRFNKCKFVLLFNKTDVLKKKISENNQILKQLLYINDVDKKEEDIIPNIDPSDYWDWLDLFQAMFRKQHASRTVFSYPLSAADPARIRSILKELEDIILQPNNSIPTLTNSETYKEKALLKVKWIAVLNAKRNEENNLPQFSFDLCCVSQIEIQKIATENNIDYNAMLYKTKNKNKNANKNKEKQVNFLISIDENIETIGFKWAKWKKTKKINTYPQSKGSWQVFDENKDNVADTEYLNAILAVLHHKELRTQFDGFTINRNPIKIRLFESNNSETFQEYSISWWNMARMCKCNAIIVDNYHYLHCKSPLSDVKMKWNWYDNDNGETQVYDESCRNQLECSYQANLESNFPLQLLENINDNYNDEKTSHSHKNKNINMEDRIFNHCMLTDLNTFMKKINQDREAPPLYVLRFGFNQNNQISYMTQLRIYTKNKMTFARDVYRTYNGRNSTWPA